MFGGGSATELDHIVSFDPSGGAGQHCRRAPAGAVRRSGDRNRRDRLRGRRLRRNELAAHDPRLATGLARSRRRASAGGASVRRRERGRRPDPDHRRLDARRGERRRLPLRPRQRAGPRDRAASAADHARLGRDARRLTCIWSAVAATRSARRPRTCCRSTRARAPFGGPAGCPSRCRTRPRCTIGGAILVAGGLTPTSTAAGVGELVPARSP